MKNKAVMKNRIIILAIFSIISISLSGQATNPQEKTKEEKEKQIQEAILQQKKAMADQKAAAEELEKLMEEHKVDLEKIKEEVRIVEGMDRPDRIYRINEDIGRSFPRSTGDFFSGADWQRQFYHALAGDAERVSWDFSKSMKGASFSRDYVVDVEPSFNNVVMAVFGDCKEGEIRIKIIMPNGKTYSDIVVDEFGNLNWRKSFTISDSENKDKVGAWKFEIKSSKASGFFRISVQAN